mmetsp:Transcript_22230/g.72045  ORF Transcript_22230/g.72045 Transcript_22230/m.72045 type:complete len:661 (+) Transcript_22230:53-2035(+)
MAPVMASAPRALAVCSRVRRSHQTSRTATTVRASYGNGGDAGDYGGYGGGASAGASAGASSANANLQERMASLQAALNGAPATSASSTYASDTAPASPTAGLLEAAEQRIANLEAERVSGRELSQQMEPLQRALADKEAEVAALKKSLEEQRSQFSSAASGDVSGLVEENGVLKKHMEQQNEIMKEKQTQLEVALQAMDRATATLQSTSRAAQALQQALEEKETQIVQMRGQIEQAESAMGRLSQLETDLLAARSEISQLRGGAAAAPPPAPEVRDLQAAAAETQSLSIPKASTETSSEISALIASVEALQRTVTAQGEAMDKLTTKASAPLTWPWSTPTVAPGQDPEAPPAPTPAPTPNAAEPHEHTEKQQLIGGSDRRLMVFGGGAAGACAICAAIVSSNNATTSTVAPPAAAPKPAAAPAWAYTALDGPEAWPALGVCSPIEAQSPIDIIPRKAKKDVDGTLNAPQFDFGIGRGGQEVVNTGHGTMQVNFPAGGKYKTVVGNRELHLLQFHFHTPSEHSFEGEHTEMEVHFVHKDAETGQLNVFGTLMEGGGLIPNAALGACLREAPAEKGIAKPIYLEPADLLPPPDRRGFYNYAGSLTTPPCAEQVNWHVFDQTIQVTDSQVIAFQKYLNQGKTISTNSRPIQPLNGRVVKKFGL